MILTHPAYGEIQLSDEDLSADVTIHGIPLKVSLFYKPEDPTDVQGFADFLGELPKFIDIAMTGLKKEHREVAEEAFEAWDDLEPDMMKELFPGRELGTPVTFEMTKSVIRLTHVFCHEDGITMDFRFANDMDYLIAAGFTKEHVLNYVSMDS